MHDRAVKAMSALAGGAVSYFLLPWLHDPLAEVVPWLNRNRKRIGDLQLLWLNRSHIDCTSMPVPIGQALRDWPKAQRSRPLCLSDQELRG